MSHEEYKEMNIEEFKEQCMMQFVQDPNEENYMDQVANTNQTNEPIYAERKVPEEVPIRENGRTRRYKMFSQEIKEQCLAEVSILLIFFLS